MKLKMKFIFVGKIKKGFWLEAVTYYKKLLGRYSQLQEVIIKDGPANLGPSQKKAVEGKHIISKLAAKDLLICLDEKGQNLSSRELARKMTQWTETRAALPCFVIGGSHGLSCELLNRADFILSLGNMTFPHELARILLLEQLYRALCILHNHPYHH